VLCWDIEAIVVLSRSRVSIRDCVRGIFVGEKELGDLI